MAGDIPYGHYPTGLEWKLHTDVLNLWNKTIASTHLTMLSTLPMPAKSIAAFFVCLYGGDLKTDCATLEGKKQLVDVSLCFTKCGLDEAAEYLRLQLYQSCLGDHVEISHLYDTLAHAVFRCEANPLLLELLVTVLRKRPNSGWISVSSCENAEKAKLVFTEQFKTVEDMQTLLKLSALIASSRDLRLPSLTSKPIISQLAGRIYAAIPRNLHIPSVPSSSIQFVVHDPIVTPWDKFYVSAGIAYCYWPYITRMMDSGMEEAKSRVCTLPDGFPSQFLQDIVHAIYRPESDAFVAHRQEDLAYALENGAEFSLFSGTSPDDPLPRFTKLVNTYMSRLFPPVNTANAIDQLELANRIGSAKMEGEILKFVTSNLKSALRPPVMVSRETNMVKFWKLPDEYQAKILRFVMADVTTPAKAYVEESRRKRERRLATP